MVCYNVVMHTVIVGGGFAGVRAALEISKRNIGKVTLISEKPYFLYHSALYSVLTGEDPVTATSNLKDIFSKHPKVKVIKDTIVSLDPARNMAVGKRTSYSYDTLVLALGSVTKFFDVKGVEKQSIKLDTLKEIAQFHTQLKDELIRDRKLDKNYVIIGGGPTGVELAGSLSAYVQHIKQQHMVQHTNIHITIVESSDRLLPRHSKSASHIVTQRLLLMGVNVILNNKVRSFDKTHITLNDKKIPTKTVIWTAGMAPHPFYKDNPEYFTLAKDGRVTVNPYLEAYRDIFVIGDAASTHDSGTAVAALSMADYLSRYLERKKKKLPALPYRNVRPATIIPVGENWAYAERWGVYVTGRIGYFARKQFESKIHQQLSGTSTKKTLK